MISATSSSTGFLGQLANDSASVKAQLDLAIEQESTGKISQNYAGLGATAQTSLDLGPQVAHLQTWQNNISTASSRLDVAQTSLTEISQIASSFYAQTNNINSVGVSETSSIAASAKLALQQVAQLLNTKEGDVYVFSGQDSGNAPIPNTNPTAIAAAVLAVPATTAPFSTTIGSSVPTIEIGQGQIVQVGLLANQNTLSLSTGTGTTGSYTRDILQGLATLANLGSSAAPQTDAATARNLLNSAITALGNEQGALGQIQSGLKARQTTLASTQTAIASQLSNVQEVDAAATLTKVQALQTQLQASYQLIAGMKSLSLTNFLPA